MNAIVMNTLNAAVTEYDWTFQSITPTHAGDATGLFLLGGDTDATVAIDATFMGAKTLIDAATKKGFEGPIYLSMTGDSGSQGLVRVAGQAASWEYPVAVAATGESRAIPGRGIRENYLGLGYRNVAGAGFRVDRLEADIAQSKSRRTGS